MSRFDELFSGAPAVAPKAAGSFDTLFEAAPSREDAAAQRLAEADPSLPQMLPDTSRSWGEVASDLGQSLRLGATEAVTALTDAPRRAANFLTGTALPAVAGVMSPWADAADFAPLGESLRIERPEAQSEFMDYQRQNIAGMRDDMSARAYAESQALGEAEGFGGVVDALVSNPGLFLTEGGRMAGNLLPVVAAGPFALPTAGATFGGMSADQVEQALLSSPETLARFGEAAREAIPELAEASDADVLAYIADTRGTDAGAASALINSILPKLIPGGATLEKALTRAPLGATRAGGAARGFGGELSTEFLQGASDQAVQNVALGEPLGQDVLKAGTLEGLLAGPLGGAVGALQSPATQEQPQPEITPQQVEQAISALVQQQAPAQPGPEPASAPPAPGPAPANPDDELDALLARELGTDQPTRPVEAPGAAGYGRVEGQESTEIAPEIRDQRRREGLARMAEQASEPVQQQAPGAVGYGRVEGQEGPPEVAPEIRDQQRREAFGRVVEQAQAAQQPEAQQPAQQAQDDARIAPIRAEVEATVSGWQNAPAVNVARNLDDLPEDVKRRAKASQQQGTPEGLYDPQTNTVHLFGDALSDPKRARWVTLHEVAGHYGIRGAVERAGGDLSSEIARARGNSTIAAVADAIAAERGVDADVAVEEALAELAAADGTGDFAGIESRYGVAVPQSMRAGIRGSIARFVEAIKRVLGSRADFTDADWRKLIEGAYRYVREPGVAPRGNGEPLRSTRSTGDTGAVKAKTKPIVSGSGADLVTLYHGTSEDAAESIRRSGVIRAGSQFDGAGVSLTPRRDIAEDFAGPGGSVIEVRVPKQRLRVDREATDHDDIDTALNDGASVYSDADIVVREDARDAAPRFSTAPAPNTPQFREWFGESKATTPQGAPLRLFHGTGEDFTVFRQQRLGEATQHATAPLGFHLTDNRQRAQQYASNAADGRPADERVMELFASIQSPYEMSLDEAQAIESPEQAQQVRERLEREGYDGIHQPETGSWIAFYNDQLKSATDNTGDFDRANPDIRFSTKPPDRVTEAEKRAEAKRNEAASTLPVDRGSPGWGYSEGKWVGRKGELNRARMSLDDKMLAWKDAQNQIEQQRGEMIPDAQNVYRMETLMHGRVSERMDQLERERIVPLVDAMKAAKVKPEALEEYLYARHAKERNAEIAKINPKMPDGGSGMTNAEADAILAKADKAKMEPLAKKVDAITRSTRRALLANGLLTQEAFDAMEQQYSHYVPLRGRETSETGFQDTGSNAGRGVDSRRSPVQAAMGRGAGNRATDILGHIIADAQNAIIVSEKARVGRTVMRLVLANPNPKLWSVEPVLTERRQDANGEVYDAVVNDWSDPSIIAVRHRGKLYRVQINSQPMAQALNNVGIDQLDWATRQAGKINRYFSAVLTKYNPSFVAVNATRDAIFGLTGLAVEHGEAAALDAALHYPLAARAAWRHARGKKGDKQWDRWATEFAENGGRTGYVSMPSAEDLARQIGSGSLSSYSPDGMVKAVRAIGEVVGNLNDGVENALRLSAYVTLRKRGVSPEKAAEYAKNLTVNFNRKGTQGSRLNAWFLFYNAAIQGAKRAGNLMRRPKTWSYLGTLAGIQVIAAMAAMGMEDDDGEPLWNKVPDHVKRRSIVIVTPDKTVLTIPMPYGFNLMTYMSGRFTGALLSEDGRPENRASQLAADVMSAAAESFLPIPVADGAMGLLPTIMRIPINVQANKTDFGYRIRNENPYAKSDLPRSSMGKADTLEVFKLMATGLNRLGGGDDYTPPPLSFFDYAPEDIEYLLGEFTGGAGKFVVDVATLGQEMTGDKPTTAKDVPITNRFVSNIDEQASQQALFYGRRDQIERSLNRVRDVFEREGRAAATELMGSMPELKGATFRVKRDGTLVVRDGRPQIVATNGNTVFGAYKYADKATSAANERIKDAYVDAPASLVPNKASRERDRKIRELQQQRMEAQKLFTTAWTRDVVGASE